MMRFESIAAGIFARENGQRLIQILMMLTDRGFSGLYERCAPDVKGRYYQTGLRRVHVWSDDVIMEDVTFVQEQCPDLFDTFNSCFSDFVSERYNGKKRPSVRPPEFVDFARRFLECIGTHTALTSADYFTAKDTILKRFACMDSARQALYTMVSADTVRVELQSEVSAPPYHKNEFPSPSRSQATFRKTSDLAVDDIIHPSDSVSQVGSVREDPPPPPPQRNVEEEYIHVPVKTVDRASSPTPSSHISRSANEDTRSTASRGTTASRHIFDDREDAPQKVASPYLKKSVASSRDSQVSIGVKRVKSPKGR